MPAPPARNSRSTTPWRPTAACAPGTARTAGSRAVTDRLAGDPTTMTDRDSAPRYLSPAALSQPGGHYSHACVANGMVYVSGQLPIRPDGALLADAPFDTQARQALANVAAAPARSEARRAGNEG